MVSITMQRPFVVNRQGEHVPIRYDRITDRVEQLGRGLNIVPENITHEVAAKIIPGMKTCEIDTFVADICDQFVNVHPDYRKLAARVANDNLASDLPESFARCIAVAHFFDWKYTNHYVPLPAPGSLTPPKDTLISNEFYAFVWHHADALDAIYTPRFTALDYMGFRMLERKYLLRIFYNSDEPLSIMNAAPNDSPLPGLGEMPKMQEPANQQTSSRLLTVGKSASRVIETPAGLYLRVAVEIARALCKRKCSGGQCPDGCDAIKHIAILYNMMYRDRLLTFATPALINAGSMRHNSFVSCFLLNLPEDSIEGIYELLGQCARISKQSGGIGISWSKIRATGSYIGGTNSTSGGVYPALRVFTASSQYVGQHGNNRPGSMANYFEPWHADLLSVIRGMDPHSTVDGDLGSIRKLFYGLFISDLFMTRVHNDEMWTFMSPDICPGLAESWGEKQETLYLQYESEGRGSSQMPARKVWDEIIKMKILTGQPYMLSKDACNALSNQQHLGTIEGSNLCTEIVEFHGWRVATEVGDTEPSLEIACCTLASISLNEMVVERNGVKQFDFDLLQSTVRNTTRYLDMVVDVTNYPNEYARNSNMRHRPLGLGVRGLADAFLQLDMPFTSPEAQALDKRIFETLYFAALTESTQLAVEKGTYPSYAGSPASRGLLHMDLWEARMRDLDRKRVGLRNAKSLRAFPTAVEYDPSLDWAELRATIKRQGLRNSLLVAPMPTESTSRIIGGSKSFEPYQYLMYRLETNSGSYRIVNPYMAEKLSELGLWNDELIREIEDNQGSMANISGIPDHIKAIFQTSGELKQRTITAMAAARQPFIDQSMSLNHRMRNPTVEQFSVLMFDSWLSGLKTFSYYLATESAVTASKITKATASKRELAFKPVTTRVELDVCRMEPNCESCSA